MFRDLEWSKINNEKLFQRLSNHLFAFECLYSGFVPSSPYIGKDGGWDGRWKGEYERQKGLFSIQAKWTTKSFDDAASHLRDELPSEIKNAEQQKVDHLIITTNAELRVDHIVALEKLKRRKLKTLQIWHREKLDLKLKGHPFLCYYYFGNAQFPSFVPASIYFPAYEASLLEGNLVGRDKELEEIAKEVLLKQGTITVVHAPGGHGKSHFLQGCAGRLENCRNGQVLFVRPFLRNLQDAVQDELVAGREYILCLDDADRFLEEVPKLISLTRASPNVRIVLACRTAGLRLIKDAMQNYRLQQAIVKELRSLGEADLKQILIAAAGRRIDKAEQIIAALDGVPFLIVQYGKRIGKSITDEEISKIYDLLGTSVADDAARVLNQILEKADQEDLLLHLAAIVPFRQNDQVVTKLAEVLEKPTRIVNLSLERLLEGKVLRRIGNNVRFYPDMSGDIYLSSRLAGDPEKSERLFDTWFVDASLQIVSNLAGAASFEKTDAIRRMLSRTIRRWIDAPKNESSWRRVEKLKYLQQIAHLAPIESLDLIHAYLPAAPLAKDPRDHPDLDDYGPVVLILTSYAPLKILQLIKKIEELGLPTRFDTYKPARLARFLVSPVHQTIATIQSVANELLAWVSNPQVSVTEAFIASEATKEILAGAHEHTESFRDTMTFGERVVKNIPGVHGLRDTALTVVKALLNNKKYCDFGVDIADDIGSTRMHRISETEIPLADRIAADRRTVLTELEALNLDALSPVTVSKIEDLLLKWWLMNKRGTQEATKILTYSILSPKRGSNQAQG